MPTKMDLTEKTGLSRQTIHKHLKEYTMHPLYQNHQEQFRFMADKVLARIFHFATNGDVKAAKLYFDILGKNFGSTQTNYVQNNYVQINNIKLSQDKIKQLSPDKLKEIFAALKRRGWWDNALVVFLSDHGEMAGDHLRLSKTVFYDSSVRVPLIIRCPSQINGGATSDAIAQNIDVYPTLLEAVEAEPSKRCFGKSLWPVLNDPGLGHREAAFSEISAGGYHSTMVCTDRYKYAMDHTGQGYMLHDMNDDPKEQNNLIGHPGFQEIEQECRDRILCFLLDTQCRTSREKKI